MGYICGKIHAGIIQGEQEWFDIKRGKVGASSIKDLMSKGKGNTESSGRRNLRAKLIAERLTGTTEQSFTNQAMQWGTDNEPAARQVYEFIKSVDVVQVGFIEHPEIEYAGMSPDGLVGDDGLLEIKCPNTATHIDYILAGVVPSEYVKQVQFQMACSGRLWCDFMSYDPRMPIDMQCFIVRAERDNELIKEMDKELILFNNEVDETIKRLQEANK